MSAGTKAAQKGASKDEKKTDPAAAAAETESKASAATPTDEQKTDAATTIYEHEIVDDADKTEAATPIEAANVSEASLVSELVHRNSAKGINHGDAEKAASFRQRIADLEIWAASHMSNGRERALVLTKLDEARLWGVEAFSARGPIDQPAQVRKSALTV